MLKNKKSGVIRKKRTFYAQVSNVALRDKTLSLKAKGLLAIIESYLTLDNFILYKDFLLSKSTDGETSFRGAWKELKEHGYLIQYKLKDEVTKQFYYEYEICDNPYVENQLVGDKMPDNEKPQVENPHMDIQYVDNPQVEKLNAGLSTCSKPYMYNNNVLNNTLYINIIHSNIDYDTVFINSNNKDIVDNIVDIMNEVLCAKTEYIPINGNNIPINVVRSTFLKVNMNHIQYIINVLNQYHKKINNIKGFIITTLYNSVITLDTYYTNLVQTDVF